MDRPPGLSVRLKLTLSYAGFLMLAGALLLVAGWVYLTRTDHIGLIVEPGYHGSIVRTFAPIAAIAMGFLLLFGLAGGWFLAGRMLAPLERITVSALRKRLGDPEIIATVPGAGYRISIHPDTAQEGGQGA